MARETATMPYHTVGKSEPRFDALDKVTGKAVFCTDLSFPGMLHAKILRSPYPHAVIKSIDTRKAQELRGVRVILTGNDLPQEKWGGSVFDQSILARRIVRYIGDPVAAVAADTVEAAERAIQLIDVAYEPLPAVFSIEEAFQKSPPALVHPDLPNYLTGRFPKPHRVPDRPNVCHHRKIRHGDTEAGFREAEIVVENRFEIPRVQHCPLEPHIGIAKVGIDGSVTIWGSRQAIFVAKQAISNMFGLPPSKVRVITSHYLGGAFGNKSTLHTEPIVVLLAMRSQRPVRLAYTREEMFTCGGARVPAVIDIKDGLKKDGTLVARKMTMLYGVGAYAGQGPLVTQVSVHAIAAGYRIPNLTVDVYSVYTNEPFVTAFRGFGNTQAIWAIESQMDMIAEKLSIDPVELRRKNLLREGDINGNGEIVHSTGIEKCMDLVAASIEKGKRPEQDMGPWKRGVGLALGNKYSMAPTAALALVRVLEDGTIEVFESADEDGQGSVTVLGQIAAEEFRVPMNKVKVVWGDTDVTPYLSRGSTSQRTTFNLGNAVRLACQDAKRQLCAIAAERLEAVPDDLNTKGGKIYVVSDPSRTLDISDLFTTERGLMPGEHGSYVEKEAQIIGKGIWITRAAPSDPETGQIPSEIARKGGRAAGFYSYSAQAVEVLVNTGTGEIKIERIEAAVDVGYPLNPKMCEQQIEGAISMGLGAALWEEILLRKGRVLNPYFRDYQIALPQTMPKLENFRVHLVSSPHREGPYGAKGMAEVPITPVAPAIANAIYNAVGVRIKELPVTPEKMLFALEEKNQSR